MCLTPRGTQVSSGGDWGGGVTCPLLLWPRSLPHRAALESQIPPDPQQLPGTFSPLLSSHGRACVLLQGRQLGVGLQGIFYSHCTQAAAPFPAALTLNSNAGTESWKENVFNASPARGPFSLVHTQTCGNHCPETSAAFQQQSERFRLKAGC